MSENNTLSIHNTTKGKLPSLPFLELKESILGKKYDLSLVFIGSKRSRSLNKTHRGKDKATNILSFELSKTSGEIYIDFKLAKKQAKNFDRSESNFLAFLFIHGLFHLKGFSHGDTMEKAEQKVRSKFNI